MSNSANEGCRACHLIAFCACNDRRTFFSWPLIIHSQIERSSGLESAAGVPDRHARCHVEQADNRARGEHFAIFLAEQILTPGKLQLDPILPRIAKFQAKPARMAMLGEELGGILRIKGWERVTHSPRAVLCCAAHFNLLISHHRARWSGLLLLAAQSRVGEAISRRDQNDENTDN